MTNLPRREAQTKYKLDAVMKLSAGQLRVGKGGKARGMAAADDSCGGANIVVGGGWACRGGR